MLVWMPPWVVFSVIIHELGHMLGARMAGLRVAYCGVGIQKPLFSFGIGETRYFFGLWPINGLTLIVHDGPRVPTGPMVFAVAAGPLTNLAMGVVALTIDLLQPGAQPAWSMLATVSFLLTLNLLPIRSKGTGFTFRTDGMMILQLLNGTLRHGLSTGIKLRNHELLRELGEQVRSPLAMAAHELALAYETRRSLGDREAAEEWLNQAANRQQMPEWTRAMQEWMGQRPIDSPDDVEWVRQTSRPYLLQMRAERFAEIGNEAEAQRLFQLANELANQHRCIEVQEAISIKNATEVDRLLNLTGRYSLEPTNRLQLLSNALARTDSTSADFQHLLGQFQSALQTEAISIDDDESQNQFLTHWLRPIAEHAFGNPDQWRILSPDIPTNPEKPLPNWPGRISLWLWAVSIFLNWGQAAPSAADVGAVQHSMLIVLISTLGLFLGGVGLARSGERGRKAAFVGTLGNALQVAGICVRLLIA